MMYQQQQHLHKDLHRWTQDLFAWGVMMHQLNQHLRKNVAHS